MFEHRRRLMEDKVRNRSVKKAKIFNFFKTLKLISGKISDRNYFHLKTSLNLKNPF